MKALVLIDKEYRTETFESLYGCVRRFLIDKGFTIEEKLIGREDLAYCMGCFGCWIKKPGECVINDMVADINLSFNQSDTVIYLCPVVFGQFSANIKNALDRWIPNVLPFFYQRPDGSTMHPQRYETIPKTVMIAYADNLMKEDEQLFIDVTKKHRPNENVLIYHNSSEKLIRELSAIEMKREGVKR